LIEDACPADCLRQFKDDIRNIHAEAMRKGTHKHLQLGKEEIGYTGIVKVELSPHSRNAVKAAEQVYEF